MTQEYGLLYYSFADDELDTNVIRFIADKARTRNAAFDVTGHLHYESGLFVQWIEGSKQNLNEIYGYIRRDPHHHGLTSIFFDTIPARGFSSWNMATSMENNASLTKFMRERNLSLADHDQATIANIIGFLRNAAMANPADNFGQDIGLTA